MATIKTSGLQGLLSERALKRYSSRINFQQAKASDFKKTDCQCSIHKKHGKSLKQGDSNGVDLDYKLGGEFL